MIVGFDWDGTLVESWTATPLPGVREQLAALPPGTRTFIATNQAGPVWRRMTADTKYPTCEEVAQRLIAGLAALDWRPDALFIATCAADRQDYTWFVAAQEAMQQLYDRLQRIAYVSVSAMPIDRRPGGGMLLDAAEHFDHGCLSCDHILYIGDMDTDKQAAARVGARYLGAAAWRENGIP